MQQLRSVDTPVGTLAANHARLAVQSTTNSEARIEYTMTIPSWPPPGHARRVLRRARRRYHALQKVYRPSLGDPRSYVGLFKMNELVTLAKCGYWPLPWRALAWLVELATKRALRLERQRRRVEAITRRLIAAELPEAVDYLLRRSGG